MHEHICGVVLGLGSRYHICGEGDTYDMTLRSEYADKIMNIYSYIKKFCSVLSVLHHYPLSTGSFRLWVLRQSL